MAEVNIMQWNKAPDYDAWGFDDWWVCGQWMGWQYAWDKGNTAKFIGGGHLGCRMQGDFANFAKDNGLEVSSPISSLYLGTGNILSSLGTGVERTAAIIAWLVPIILIMLVLAAAYLIFKTIKTGQVPLLKA